MIYSYYFSYIYKFLLLCKSLHFNIIYIFLIYYTTLNSTNFEKENKTNISSNKTTRKKKEISI